MVEPLICTLSVQTFARSENREIYDINFREFNEKIHFASINFRELGDQNGNFHTKNDLKVTNTSWIRFKVAFFYFDEAFTFAKRAKIRENRETFCSRKFVHLK